MNGQRNWQSMDIEESGVHFSKLDSVSCSRQKWSQVTAVLLLHVQGRKHVNMVIKCKAANISKHIEVHANHSMKLNTAQQF